MGWVVRMHVDGCRAGHRYRAAGRLAIIVLLMLAGLAGASAASATTPAAASTALPGAVLPGALPHAVAARWQWPLAGTPRVLRGFEPPPTRYAAGHRGVDLAAPVGAAVLAAGAGVVGYAGTLAGRGVVTVVHGGLRTTYEPVAAAVRPGQLVAGGTVLGHLQAGPHCGLLRPCLHWGLLRGRVYLDPLALLGLAAVRLLPVWDAGRSAGRTPGSATGPAWGDATGVPESARGAGSSAAGARGSAGAAGDGATGARDSDAASGDGTGPVVRPPSVTERGAAGPTQDAVAARDTAAPTRDAVTAPDGTTGLTQPRRGAGSRAAQLGSSRRGAARGVVLTLALLAGLALVPPRRPRPAGGVSPSSR